VRPTIRRDLKGAPDNEGERVCRGGPGARLGRGGADRRDRGGCGAGGFPLYFRAVQLPPLVAKARVLLLPRKTSD